MTDSVPIYDAILSLCKRRGFLWPAFELYGGSAGFYDYGPLGSRLKQRILDVWRQYYVIGENFAEIDSPNITPEPVLKASGHVDHFSDYLVRCTKCEESYRLDTLLKDAEGMRDGASLDEMVELMRSAGSACPACKGALGEPAPFNLMFGTHIGPTSEKLAYLRPETAQGIFINFATLYRYARERFPFGVIQIGKGFRNEISPRQGLLRLREFNMAEAEVFVDPDNKTWQKYDTVKGDVLTLVPRDGAMVTTSIDDAVKKGIIANEALAYFIALTNRFLQDIGIKKEKLRFRQHLADEMAHYAIDCWDAEALNGYGWIEIVGVADRGCYDVQQHIDHSKQQLGAFRKFDAPVEVTRKTAVVDMKKLGPAFGKKSGAIKTALAALDDAALADAENGVTLTIDGETVDLTADMYTITTVTEKQTGESFVPHVIEPSHGIDRILYTVLEHAYEKTEKEGESYTVLRLAPRVAPLSVGVFPLVSKDGLDEIAHDIDRRLRSAGIITSYDDVGSIGRRYARADEVGVPLCITVDYDTKNDATVTIRDRDTTKQERRSLDDLIPYLYKKLA